MPFADMKVLDLTTFWAGAYLTCYLGAFGAEIVKVESIQRPDGFRYSGAWAHEGDRWYERSAMWQGTNLNKRDITLDLTSDAGRELVRRLVRDADVVVENFSPRVIEQFGLDYESLVELKPDVILVRMPGFGLQGPWRDYVGWAFNFEQTSGMSAATGYAEGPPCNLQGPADPIVGVHAGVALLAALEHRRRTGEGQLVEIAQIEVAACGRRRARDRVLDERCRSTARRQPPSRLCAGRVPDRRGRRVGGALACATTRTGRTWSRRWGDPSYWRRFGGASRTTSFDAVVAEWTRTRSAAEIVDVLSAQHVPAEQVLTAERMYDIPQLDARGYYEEVEHPITGPHRYPGWPFKMTPGPAPSPPVRAADARSAQRGDPAWPRLDRSTSSPTCARDASSVRPRSTLSRRGFHQ